MDNTQKIKYSSDRIITVQPPASITLYHFLITTKTSKNQGRPRNVSLRSKQTDPDSSRAAHDTIAHNIDAIAAKNIAKRLLTRSKMSHTKHNTFLKLFCIILLICQIACPNLANRAIASEPTATIKELTATTSETSLLFFATLDNQFSPEMIEILHSGIPLKFIFFVELHKISANWPEEQMAALELQHTISYDTLKETYRVTLEEEDNRIFSFRSLQDAQQATNELNGIKVVDIKQIIPDNRYVIRVKAELEQKKPSLSLNSMFPFLSRWDIKTDWHQLEFTY